MNRPSEERKALTRGKRKEGGNKRNEVESRRDRREKKKRRQT
jgi:hypothetical protein